MIIAAILGNKMHNPPSIYKSGVPVLRNNIQVNTLRKSLAFSALPA